MVTQFLYEGTLNENDNCNQRNDAWLQTFAWERFNENDNFRNEKLVIHGYRIVYNRAWVRS